MNKKDRQYARRERRNLKKRKQKMNRGAFMISVVVLALFCIVSVRKVQLEQKSVLYAEEQQRLDKQIEAEQKEKASLKEKEDYMQTKKYVEDVAKDKLGLVNKDEVIFKKEK